VRSSVGEFPGGRARRVGSELSSARGGGNGSEDLLDRPDRDAEPHADIGPGSPMQFSDPVLEHGGDPASPRPGPVLWDGGRIGRRPSMRLTSQRHSHERKGIIVRTLKLAGLAAVGLAALTACSNAQGTALYVGDERVSEATLDGYVDDTVDSYLEQGASPDDIDYANSRQQTVLCVVFDELGQRLDLPEPDTAAAQSDLEARCIAGQEYLNAIAAESEARELTEDELAHLRGLGWSFDELPEPNQQDLRHAAGFSDLLNGYIEEYDIRVNPRYGLDAYHVMPEELDGLFDVEIPQR
jgi:hypothetical protein